MEKADQELITILQENAIMDFNKSELDKFQKARLIQNYMDYKGIGVTAMGKMLGLAKTTVHGWLVYNNITREEYQDLKDIGITDSQIFNCLKSSKDVSKLEPKTVIAECNILVNTLKRIQKRVKDGDRSVDLLNRLHEIKNSINKVMMYVEKAIKN